MDYNRHYKEFSQCVAFAIRSWHHYVHINNRANEDKAVLNAMNKAARFWLDHRYSAIQTTIIFLGKIFDNDPDAFGIDKFMRVLSENCEYFSKPKLRARKIASAGEFEDIDEYIATATELELEGIKAIKVQVKKAKVLWELLRPIRNKIYAHNGMLSDDERSNLFQKVKNVNIQQLLQILANLQYALQELEFNGKKIDFSKDYAWPFEAAQRDAEKLIQSLL